MNCNICGKEIDNYNEGYIELSSLVYHHPKQSPALYFGDEPPTEKNEIISDDNKKVYCEECFEINVEI